MSCALMGVVESTGGRWFAAKCLSFVSLTDRAVVDAGRRDEARNNNKCEKGS